MPRSWQIVTATALPGFAGGGPLNVYLFLSQFIYQSNHDVLLGGKWGLDLIIPVVVTDLSYSVSGPFPRTMAPGWDVLVGPFLQDRTPIRLAATARFSCTGSSCRRSSPPANTAVRGKSIPAAISFSFDPYWAATLFITQWEFSTRVHYLWNTRNNDPNRQYTSPDGTRAGSTLAGQAVHLNFASSYEIHREAAPRRGEWLLSQTDHQHPHERRGLAQ